MKPAPRDLQVAAVLGAACAILIDAFGATAATVLLVLAGTYFVFSGLFGLMKDIEPDRGRCSFCERPKSEHDRGCPIAPRR